MGPAVEAVNLGKQFPRKQVGVNIFKRLFGRGKPATSPGAKETAATAEAPGTTGAMEATGTTGAGETAPANLIVAVKNVSFAVHPGEVFGFLGPNGAGKTTTIRMLATLLEPSTGHAFICGHDVGQEAMAARAKLGAVLAGDRSLYWKLSGRENLQYFATLYRVPRHDIPRRIEDVLRRMHLLDRADEMVERYSTGMKQRLALARALLADPPVLLLDEPTLGLDPQSARNLRDIVLELKDEGRAILLTTHYMDEADFLSDRIAIIDHGEIIALDTPQRLKGNLAGERVHRMELAPVNGGWATAAAAGAEASGTGRSPSAPGVFEAVARQVPGLRIVEERLDAETGSAHVSFVLNGGAQTGHIWRALAEAETNVLNYSVEEPTLEDVFISLTGRGLRE